LTGCLLILVVVACSQPATTTVATPADTTMGSTTTNEPPAQISTGDVSGFEVATIEIAGEQRLVAVADTAERQSRGLMRVAALGDLTGMLFVFPEPQIVGFWMKDVSIPLDLAFIDGSGIVVSIVAMDLCDDVCPSYQSPTAVSYALEIPRGSVHMEIGDRIGLPPDGP
jgi:uncharacterized protein